MIRQVVVERRKSPEDFSNDSWIGGGDFHRDQDGKPHVVTLRMKGKVYTFCNVPKLDFTRMARTGSKGSYYHRNNWKKYYCPAYLPGAVRTRGTLGRIPDVPPTGWISPGVTVPRDPDAPGVAPP